MKTLAYLSSLFLIIVTISGCHDTCESTSTYVYFEPVFTQMSEIRSQVGLADAREISQSGKIYLINDHLLINEPGKGIHIIDNSDPRNPDNVAFINIPGNYDMAAVDGYLYADSYIDLVVIDIHDVRNPYETYRVKDVFPNYNWYGWYDSNDNVVTGWKEVKHVNDFKSDCDGGGIHYPWGYRGETFLAMDMAYVKQGSNGSVSPGIGGSMARFTITNEITSLWLTRQR